MDANHLKNYDPSALMDFYEKIKLPSGEEISTNPENIRFELYKRSKKILKEALELKEEFLVYLQLKMDSDPYEEKPFSYRLVTRIHDGSKIYLEYFDGIKDLMDRYDPVILKAFRDMGQSMESVRNLIVFFETCLDIALKDKKKHNAGGWR